MLEHNLHKLNHFILSAAAMSLCSHHPIEMAWRGPFITNIFLFGSLFQTWISNGLYITHSFSVLKYLHEQNSSRFRLKESSSLKFLVLCFARKPIQSLSKLELITYQGNLLNMKACLCNNFQFPSMDSFWNAPDITANIYTPCSSEYKLEKNRMLTYH